MKRHSRHRIWLRDIYPYVFCQKYKKRHQVTKNGTFEIYFVNEEGIFCQSFLDLLAQKSNAFFSAADAFEDTFREGSEIESTDA
jgi:hypothetical protein